jgi:hypothetical protein
VTLLEQTCTPSFLVSAQVVVPIVALTSIYLAVTR